MNLNWSITGYEMVLASPREHHLVRDALVEGAYIVDGLPDVECVARLGRTEAEVQHTIDSWWEFRPHRNLSVPELELIRACFSETLDFFSDAEYSLRTGWTKEEAADVFLALLKDRKRITIMRKWGQV